MNIRKLVRLTETKLDSAELEEKMELLTAMQAQATRTIARNPGLKDLCELYISAFGICKRRALRKS